MSSSTPIPTPSSNYAVQSNIGFALYGVQIGPANELDPYDLVSSAVRSLGRGHVPQYENEADKLASLAMPVTLATPPDLQVDRPRARTTNAGHVFQGQTLDVTYTVTNLGAATPPTMARWDDLIYFSADANLDLKADRYLGMVMHTAGLSGGASYTVTTTVQVPQDLSGPYYLFVITDPPTDSAIGKVFEGGATRTTTACSSPPRWSSTRRRRAT